VVSAAAGVDSLLDSEGEDPLDESEDLLSEDEELSFSLVSEGGDLGLP